MTNAVAPQQCWPALGSEQELLERAREGDSEAFSILYLRHKRRVYSLCLRMTGNPALAEELTQEAFLAMFRRIQTFRGDSSLATWLHRVTVNCVLMHLRQQNSRIQELTMIGLDSDNDETGYVAVDFGSCDERLEGTLDRVALERAVQHLPPGYRLIWFLHDIEGYEHSEIAEILGCSTGNTKSQLHKARLKLRRLLLQRRHRAR
jgi:RNA polymerase sigma-70 factor (ECF subfamily)